VMMKSPSGVSVYQHSFDFVKGRVEREGIISLNALLQASSPSLGTHKLGSSTAVRGRLTSTAPFSDRLGEGMRT